MTKISLAAAACAALSVLAWTGAALAAPPPPHAFGRREAVQAAAISPDGQKVALISGTTTERTLSIATIDQPNPVLLSLGDVRTWSVRWGGNDHVLVRVTVYEKLTGWKYPFNFTRDLIFDSKGKLKGWLLNNNAESSLMFGLPIYKIVHGDKPVAYMRGLAAQANMATNNTRFAEDRSIVTPALYKVDIATGRGSIVERSPAFDWAIDTAGELHGRMDPVESVNERVQIDDRAYTLYGRGKGQALWKELARVNKSRDASIEGYSAAEDVLYWRQEDGAKGVARIYKTSFKDGATSVVPAPDDAVDAWVRFDPDTDEPLSMLHTTGADLHYKWLQPKFGSVHGALRKLFKGKEVELRNWSTDRTRFIVRVWSSDELAAWYLFDGARKEVSALGEEYPELKGASLGRKTFFSYRARDGLTIPAYLHIPVASSGKDLPLIVLPHGGPEARDDSDFDWWAQFLASRGYAVLQPQFRGSGGFGYDFRMAGRQEWAGKMQTDLVDGITDLAARGVVDPRRVCIVGASYGGYAALYGMTSLTDTYKCGASVNGVADPGGLVVQLKNRFGEGATLLLNLFGDNRKEVAHGSPLRSASAAKGPILLVYSALDTTVPPKEQTVAMAEQLKQAGKDVTLIQLQGDDHYLHSSSSRIQMLTAMDAFLAKHLPVTP